MTWPFRSGNFRSARSAGAQRPYHRQACSAHEWPAWVAVSRCLPARTRRGWSAETARNSTISAGAFDGETGIQRGCGVRTRWPAGGPGRFAGRAGGRRRVRAMFDAGRHAGGGDHLSRSTTRCSVVAGAAAFQLVGPRPSAWWRPASAGCPRRPGNGPGADAGGPGGGGVNPAQPLPTRLVGLLGGQGAADDHDIGLLSSGPGWPLRPAWQPAGVVGDRSGLGGPRIPPHDRGRRPAPRRAR